VLEVYLIAGVLIVSTVVTHAVGTTLLVRQLRRHLERPDAGFKGRRAMLAQIWAVFVLTLLHVVEIHLWALAYLVAIAGDQTDTYEKVAYFSFVTFTTLGYGDIVLQGPERLLTGIEALNGMLLIGWSVALLFQVVRRAWKIPNPVP